MAINLNILAKEIALIEGKKESVSIAQIKEVIKITLEKLAAEDIIEVLKLLRRYE